MAQNDVDVACGDQPTKKKEREEGRADRLFPNNIGINDDEEEKERGKQRPAAKHQWHRKYTTWTNVGSDEKGDRCGGSGSGEISKRRRTKGTEEERKRAAS